jgi:hypothetical protein
VRSTKHDNGVGSHRENAEWEMGQFGRNTLECIDLRLLSCVMCVVSVSKKNSRNAPAKSAAIATVQSHAECGADGLNESS